MTSKHPGERLGFIPSRGAPAGTTDDGALKRTPGAISRHESTSTLGGARPQIKLADFARPAPPDSGEQFASAPRSVVFWPLRRCGRVAEGGGLLNAFHQQRLAAKLSPIRKGFLPLRR
jgi:hypothetical protein